MSIPATRSSSRSSVPTLELMVDLPEDTVFRTVFEERSNQIAMRFQADGRMLHSQSYDYSVPGQLTVMCFESAGGKPFVFVVSAKTSVDQVDRELTKTISAYDRSA